jgi:26S proteasome regulatory subunit N7
MDSNNDRKKKTGPTKKWTQKQV